MRSENYLFVLFENSSLASSLQCCVLRMIELSIFKLNAIKILYHEIKNILRDTMISDKIGGAVKIDAKNKGNVCTEKYIQGK